MVIQYLLFFIIYILFVRPALSLRQIKHDSIDREEIRDWETYDADYLDSF